MANRERTRTFASATGVLLVANAADLLTTFTALTRGRIEGDNILESISPWLSPRYLVEHYGFSALIP